MAYDDINIYYNYTNNQCIRLTMSLLLFFVFFFNEFLHGIEQNCEGWASHKDLVGWLVS